jgi:hypothetical protein
MQERFTLRKIATSLIGQTYRLQFLAVVRFMAREFFGRFGSEYQALFRRTVAPAIGALQKHARCHLARVGKICAASASLLRTTRGQRINYNSASNELISVSLS